MLYTYRQNLEKKFEAGYKSLLRQFADPNARFVKEISILNQRTELSDLTDFRILVEARNLSLNLERYKKLLNSQKAVHHFKGEIFLDLMFICRIKNVLFDTKTGIICTEDNGLLIDSALDIRRLRKSETYLAKIPPHEKVRSLQGVYSSIHGLWQNNHFHWMIESLPRLYSLKLWQRPVNLLVPDNLDDLKKSTLVACLPPNVQNLYYVPEERWLRIEEFIFPSFPVKKHFPILPVEYVNYIRDGILKYFALDSTARSEKRIYISRSNARHGKLLNEEGVLDLLKPYGFEVYHLESLSMAKQAELFHTASIIVAPHGAGLANLIFSNTVKVVELHNLALVPTYFILSTIMNNDYFFVLPLNLDFENLPDPFLASEKYSRLKRANYLADLDQLKKTVDMLCC